MTYAFEDFTFDVDKQQLHREGDEVHIEPKAMQLLEILISRRPNVVKHEELYDAIWPDVAVLEANLGNLVSDLRAALGDHDRKLIRTAHGRGYAFSGDVGNVSTESDAARVVLLHQGRRRLVFRMGENIIGRGADADIRIDDTEISRHHASVVVEADRTTIEDLGSKNGTRVNGERIEGRVPVGDGDEIRLGPIALRVSVVIDTGRTKTSMRE